MKNNILENNKNDSSENDFDLILIDANEFDTSLFTYPQTFETYYSSNTNNMNQKIFDNIYMNMKIIFWFLNQRKMMKVKF